MTMDIRPIRCDEDLTWAIEEIAPYFEAAPLPGSPEADRFDVLATLIEAYEATHHPVPDSDPVAVLTFAIAEMGRSQSDLAELLGSRSRASEILSRRRALSLEQIRRISEAWHLPIAALARPYRVSRDAA